MESGGRFDLHCAEFFAILFDIHHNEPAVFQCASGAIRRRCWQTVSHVEDRCK